MSILDQKQISELITTRKHESDIQRADLARFQAKGISYFVNRHWVRTQRSYKSKSNGTSLAVDYSPESRSIRVTDNIITVFTQLAEASTHPFAIPVRIRPYFGDISSESLARARASEIVIESDFDNAKRLSAITQANFLASILGSHLIVLELVRSNNEWSVHWRPSPSIDLMLDPAFKSPELQEHEEVVLKQIYTLPKLKAFYGIEVRNKDDAPTVGQLATDQITAGEISGGAIFSEYVQNSRTKAVEIYQIHRKSDSTYDRFDEFHVYWNNPDTGKIEPISEELESQPNPFGFDGLPIGLINYHSRPNTPFGQGVTHQMIPNQDLINLHETIYTRQAQLSASPTWIFDKKTRPDIEGGLSNRVPGMIFFSSGTQQERRVPPTSIRTADPYPGHIDRSRELKQEARMKSHRSQLNQGLSKSHVPDATTQRLLEEGDKVPNIIVENYSKVLQRLHLVELGTKINSIQHGSIRAINRWQKRGLSFEHFTALKSIDPNTIDLTLTIERDSIRPRPPQARRAEIMNAATPGIGLLSPIEARMALVLDADLPLTSYDRKMMSFSEKAVERIIAGEDWNPIEFDELRDHEWLINSFKQALLEFSDNNDENGVGVRIRQAISSQNAEKMKLIQQQQQLASGGQGQNGSEQPQAQPIFGGVDVGSLR